MAKVKTAFRDYANAPIPLLQSFKIVLKDAGNIHSGKRRQAVSVVRFT
jgi:hypothetical protein